MMKRIFFPGLLMLCFATQVEAAYVSERLYLGLYAEPNTTADPIKTMPSGTEVQIVETQGDYVKLKLTDGTEGWARGEFVTQETPAKRLLKEMTAERDGLRLQLETLSKQDKADDQQVKTLQQQLATANRQVTNLTEQLKQKENAADAALEETQTNQQQAIDELKNQLLTAEQQTNELQTRLADTQKVAAKTGDVGSTKKVLWFTLSMFASLGIGMFIGVRWLSAKIRQRFNGLKVW